VNGLQPGESRQLQRKEIEELFKYVGIKKPAGR